MEQLINVGAHLLRLIPLIMVFYVPALLGTATLRERGKAYKVKAGLWFILGFGLVIGLHLLLRSATTAQVLGIISISLIQVAVALALAVFTVYRLAD